MDCQFAGAAEGKLDIGDNAGEPLSLWYLEPSLDLEINWPKSTGFLWALKAVACVPGHTLLVVGEGLEEAKKGMPEPPFIG